MSHVPFGRLALGASVVCAGTLSFGCGSSGASSADGGTDARTAVDTGAREAGKPESGASEAAAPDKAPITGLTANTWTWVPVDGALCRDGSSTGFGVSLGTSNNLMIFLEGGNACFNYQSCSALNPSSFDAADFHDLVTTQW